MIHPFEYSLNIFSSDRIRPGEYLRRFFYASNDGRRRFIESFVRPLFKNNVEKKRKRNFFFKAMLKDNTLMRDN